MSATSEATTTAPPRALLLRELLAACVSVASHAGAVIRDVVREGGDLGMVNKADDKYDPQTVADRRSQQRIVYALRQVWPHVQIVGEEGELAHPAPADVVVADLASLAGVDFSIPDTLAGELAFEDIVLWIDPLDGTKKFAEQKYDEVSVLIGIAFNKRPIAGVLHLPFSSADGTTYWGGGDGIGLFVSSTTHHTRLEPPTVQYPQRPLVVTTSGTPCALVDAALGALSPASVTYGGATGTMVLTVITGASDVFLRFRAATKRWDICAVEPLLAAIGGSLVDKHGRLYTYDPHGDPAFDNDDGLVVTLSEATTTFVLKTMATIELTRTLDGQSMVSPVWLQSHVFPTNNVFAARVVHGSIRRGKQSSVFQLAVSFVNDGDATRNVEASTHSTTDDTSLRSQQLTQHTLFVKRFVPQELPRRASAAHWERDIQSFRTESRFYERFYARLHARGVALVPPRAVLHGDRDNAFILLLDSIDTSQSTSRCPLQQRQLVHADCLSLSDTTQALMYLATLHAAARQAPDLVAQASVELWATGGWFTFDKRGGSAGLDDIDAIWTDVRTAFATEIAAQCQVDAAALETLATRMWRHASYIHKELTTVSESSQTLVHGDFKSANLFFDATTRSVVAFDWQWCGVGVGALDVAYLLNTSVAIDALTPVVEIELLRRYYDAFVALSTMTTYSFAAFERHYVLATLEYARVLISSFWRSMTPATCVAKANNTNCGLGYRSVPHVLRLIEKLDSGLRFVEHERQQKASGR